VELRIAQTSKTTPLSVKEDSLLKGLVGERGYENAILVDFQVGVVDPLLVVFDILEYHSASAMPH
jgi:hypothetical protein